MQKWKQKIISLRLITTIVAISLPLIFIRAVQAAQTPTYSSTSYGVTEYSMGAGALTNATSASYQACESLGSTVAGNATSNSYQAYMGGCTTAEPYLVFIVNNPNANLGVLSSSSTATTTTTFSVEAYLAHGYIVFNASGPPSIVGHTFHNLTTATTSQTNNEQFGMNLVSDSLPSSLSSVSHNPNGGSGVAASGYSLANNYQYNNGDEIAYSNSSSTTTTFTISYIYNITGTTPAGVYTLNQNLVCVGTY